MHLMPTRFICVLAAVLFTVVFAGCAGAKQTQLTVKINEAPRVVRMAEKCDRLPNKRMVAKCKAGWTGARPAQQNFLCTKDRTYQPEDGLTCERVSCDEPALPKPAEGRNGGATADNADTDVFQVVAILFVYYAPDFVGGGFCDLDTHNRRSPESAEFN